MSERLSLAFGLKFEDLYCRHGLARLDGCFVEVLKRRNTELHNRLMAGRAAPDELAAKAYSDLIVELAAELDDFITALFGITREVEALRQRHDTLAPLYAVKRLFVQRRAAKNTLLIKRQASMGRRCVRNSSRSSAASSLNCASPSGSTHG